MSPEEQQLLDRLFERIRQASTAPRDSEAEQFIAAQTASQPYAAYYLSQAVILQEKGLEASAERIHQLEARVAELESHAPTSPSQNRQSGFLDGITSLFGGSAPQTAQPGPWSRPATPTAAPGGAAPQAGPWGQAPAAAPAYAAPSRGGFLGGALNTAAGVAGGMLMADVVRSLFQPHYGGFGSMFGGGTVAAPVEEVVNNNYFIDNGSGQGAGQPADGSAMQQADFGSDGNDPSFDTAGYDDGGGFDDSNFA